MPARKHYFATLFTTMTLLTFLPVHAQHEISWLKDYTGEMQFGSDTYQYRFTHVEGNECKLKFEERHTDKKGAEKSRSWIFYLSDMDPAAISFKAKGKSLNISMKTFQSRKFISYYEEGEFDAYTNEIRITMNEVDLARSFIETMKENITGCKETHRTWENRDQALSWLVNNIGKATGEKIEWDQKYGQGSRPHLVDLQANSVNEKGDRQSLHYSFDLTDVNPLDINLKISGKLLMVEVPVRESKKFIKVETPEGTLFTSKLLIYTNSIESARETVNALSYLISNTTAERQSWDSYSAALKFVKENLGEVKTGDERYSYHLEYDASPAGLVYLTIGKSSSGGTVEKVKYAFYLADMAEKLKTEVSKYMITVRMGTKNKRAFIREMKDDKVTDYTPALDLHTEDLDMARDLVNALESAISHSEEKIATFSSVSETGIWLKEHVGIIETGGDTYVQQLSTTEKNENQLVLEKKLIDADGKSVETRYVLYPEDMNVEELDIKVSGSKLMVPLKTKNGKYIKKFENGVRKNFTSTVDILFADPLTAKSFMAAIRFLKENSVVEERANMSREEALAFLSENIQDIELPDDKYEQKLEVSDGEKCKMRFTRVETDKKGAVNKYIYAFNISDIHPGNSKFSVKGVLIVVNLVTRGNEKLIKPYKNGETGDFDDNFVIYTDDILVARKTLAAFESLSEGCK